MAGLNFEQIMADLSFNQFFFPDRLFRLPPCYYAFLFGSALARV